VRLSSARDNRTEYIPQTPQFNAGGFVQIYAFSKINLFLEIIGKRADGYHNLQSVMQSLELCDDLHIGVAEGEGVYIELDKPVENFPLGNTNLITKAANALLAEHKIQKQVTIKLHKRIPMGAGLGGGSSNCAATLHGLNKLLNLNLSLHRLIEIGGKLGADVPFCLMGGTALAEGIGEKLKGLPKRPHPPCHIAVACPNIHVSTAEMFAKLDLTDSPKSYETFMEAYETGDIEKISQAIYNRFTPITAKIHPEITEIINHFKANGALNAEMTGTGSAVFAYFKDEKTAQAACNKLNIPTFLTRPHQKGQPL